MKSLQNTTILENRPLTHDVYKMILQCDTSWIHHPGQFVNITLEGLYLKRPISICDWTENTLTLIYKVVGKGTEQMSKMNINDTLEILVDLGNGFTVENTPEEVVILGGGVGVPPMYGVTKECLKLKKGIV